MELFLDGVYLTEDDREKLRTKLTEDGKEQDNSFRLVNILTEQKLNKKYDI